ncbi:RHS repeat protein [Taibaiella soli]|uniref:DUF6443 domain-containing protein n=1 Tax=Taibaiella soli TaxID=1649169 RepID=A0A2W2B0G2_9BACT|nr:RHS repeat-associated core domain-containing protein [Taibaiella soli]PZF73754.1 hypothetical protein DN068_07085 [Taibaiella soli]
MKQIKSIIALFTLCALHQVGYSQYQLFPTNGNAPDGKTSPSVHQSTFVTLPNPYNANGNTSPNSFNYVRTWAMTQPLTDESQLGLNSQNSASIQTSYLNGWGNVLQKTERCANASFDLVAPVDNRATNNPVQYLPYAVSTKNVGPAHFQMQPFADQENYYLGLYPAEQKTAYSRSSTTGFDRKTYAPGVSLTGNDRGADQSIQTYPNGDIRFWGVAADLYASPYFDYYTNATYGPNTLTQKTTVNAEGIYTEEFYDKDNLLVCKKTYGGGTLDFLWTYYVYNSFGKLVCVIPPRAVDLASANGWALTPEILSGLCYTYTYNEYGQVCKTTTPGKTNPEYIVYDAKHRPVLKQTSTMAADNKWAFTIYDHKGRIAMTGITDAAYDYDGWNQILQGITGTYGNSVEHYIIAEFDPVDYQTMLNNSLSDGTVYEIYYYDQYDLHPDISGRSFVGYGPDYLNFAGTIQPQVSNNVNGLLTGKRTFIENSPYSRSWVNTVYFYDRFGRVIETQTQNPFADNTNGFWDNTALQYDFAGRTILSISDHQGWSGANKNGTKIMTKFIYDGTLNRLTTVAQKIDAGGWLNLSQDVFDGLGRLSVHTMGEVEEQRFDYNIRGQLTGINKDYVFNPVCQGNGMMNFGMTLSYDYGFSRPRNDGSIAGFVWRGAGAQSSPKSYGYNYDPAGQLNSADFNQFITSVNGIGYQAWTNYYQDYSVSNVTYDANGNMLTMNQKGVANNQNTDIDNLQYSYDHTSNQLTKVTDGITANYGLGDFQDGFNSGYIPDYNYDANGNMVTDRNKGIDYITYNYFNLPTSVNSQKGTIDNVYASDGTLLEKRIYDNNTGQTDNYRYWGNFVYRNDSLLYALNQEGRARWMPDSNMFKNDVFVRDHLGNVRSTVTVDYGSMLNYLNTNEIAVAFREAQFFDGIAPTRDDNPLTNNLNDLKCTRLNGSDPARRIGPSFLTKVMSGDEFDISCNSFYEEGNGNDNVAADAGSMMQSIIGTLSGGMGANFTSGEGVNPGDFATRLFTPDNYMNVYDALKEQATDPALPRAYLNYVVFDENMQIVQEESGAIQIGAGGSSWRTLGTPNSIKIGINGYLAVYVSNEQFRDVYFDNLYVQYKRGRLLQEQQYYPHGLAVDMGSNTPLENKFQYQSNEKHDELGIGLSDFHARQYDAQLGRFWSIDPVNQFSSGYIGMGNNPANLVDPMGTQTNGAGTGGSDIHGIKYNSIDFDWMDGIPHNGFAVAWGAGSGGGTIFDRDADIGTLGAVGQVEYTPGQGITDVHNLANLPNGFIWSSAHQSFGYYSRATEKGAFTDYTYNGYKNSLPGANSLAIADIWHGVPFQSGLDGMVNGRVGFTPVGIDFDLGGMTTTNKFKYQDVKSVPDVLGNQFTMSSFRGKTTGMSGRLVNIDHSSMDLGREATTITLFGVVSIGHFADDSWGAGLGAFGFEAHGGLGLGNGFGSINVGSSYTDHKGSVSGSDYGYNIGAGTFLLLTIPAIPVVFAF